LSRATCSACKLTPSSTSSSGAATPLKAAVVPAGGGAGGRLATKALTGRRIAIGDTLAVQRIVLPSIAAEGGAIDAVELVGVDVDAATTPIGSAPAPKRTGDGDAGAKG
jgi:hypothetical protein